MLLRNDLRRRKAIRTLRTTSPLDAATAAGQQVVVIGGVRITGAPLVGPLSDKPCAAFRTRIVNATLDVVSPEQAQVGLSKFTIERSDGVLVEIDATHAQFVIPALPLPSGSFERCKEYGLERGLTAVEHRTAKFEEVLVLAGMRLAIAGTLATEPGTRPARITGDEKSPIIIGVPF